MSGDVRCDSSKTSRSTLVVNRRVAGMARRSFSGGAFEFSLRSQFHVCGIGSLTLSPGHAPSRSRSPPACSATDHDLKDRVVGPLSPLPVRTASHSFSPFRSHVAPRATVMNDRENSCAGAATAREFSRHSIWLRAAVTRLMNRLQIVVERYFAHLAAQFEPLYGRVAEMVPDVDAGVGIFLGRLREARE